MFGLIPSTLTFLLTLPVAFAPQEAPPMTQPPREPVARPTQTAEGFLYKTLTIGAETYAYSVYVPPGYDAKHAWPVILFLHGSGERGDDGFVQTEVGIGTAIRRHYRWFPAIVVMPQCRKDQTWVGAMSTLALQCLEQTSREYNLDPQRVYLTGLSLGGQGAWFIAANFPGRFAAVVPVCGFAELGESTGLAAKLAERLAKTPIWYFHGVKDEAVPIAKGREMVEALKAVGNDIKYTEYPDGTHNVWNRAYGNAELWRWLFKQRLTPDEVRNVLPPGSR